jgi:tetratricopeptide (TPR) repeat protein
MKTMAGEEGPDDAASTKESPKIGRFDVLRVLGQGGMGRVYTAYDERLDRRVAVKVLRRDVGEQSRKRVEREAKAMAKLTHPNVVQVYEVGDDAGELFIAMEFVKGSTLEDWQAEDGRTWQEVLAAYRQAGEGLAAAHAVGMVHRDFKPQNAIVESSEDGPVRVRVLDFGLARQAGELSTATEQKAASETGASLDAKLTATGSLLGTPAYMAPEQFETADVGEAADQFGFCVSLWEGLYGERPFEADSLTGLIQAVTNGELRDPPKSASVPGWLRDALRRGLSVKPEDRWPSMRELLSALGRDPAGRRNKFLTAGLVVALVGAAGAIGNSQLVAPDELCPDAAQLLDGIWDDATRETAHSAFSTTDLPFAAAAWERVGPRLDAYANSWTAMHADTCEATELRGEQSSEVMHLRMACLEHARVGLEAATTLITNADADVVSRADQLVEGLDDLDRCADVDALQNDVPPPPPAHVETVKQARSLLAHARAQWETFRYDQASQTTQEAQDLIEGIDYPPIHAEVAFERGFALQPLGDADGALEAYRSAIQYASQSGQRDIVHQAVIRAMYLQGYVLEQPDEALALRELNLGLAAGLDDEARAWAHNTMGAVLDKKGERDEAIDWHRKAVELWSQVGGAEGEGALMARDQLAHALAGAGKHGEAQALIRQSAILRAKRLGSNHPALATSRIRVGEILMLGEQYAEAEREFRAGIELISRVLGPEHTAVGRWRNDLADALLAQGKLDEAEAEYQRALDAQAKVYGAAHPNVERSAEGLAKVRAATSASADDTSP